ncbi:glycosyl hydrolase family 28-related protein [Desemzia sp. FAM 23989]|uniref:glycosyl hydrolase family 28-related protein n=1 Tax=Desemzia sp. FAM 23989 TaxID=3259523 RepID=UPI003883A3C6
MSVDPNIKQKASYIRTKQKGSEVRESLAAGLESMSEDVVETVDRQDYVEQQFQVVLDETTGKDVISAPELLAARIGVDGTVYPNAKARIDAEQNETNRQLAQNTSAIQGETSATTSKPISQSLWKEFEDRGINVKWFGAVGDGITDDTEAIQFVLDNYSLVLLPEGTYLATHLRINKNNVLLSRNKVTTFIKSMKSADLFFIEIDISASASALSNITVISDYDVNNTQNGIGLLNAGSTNVQDTNIQLMNVEVLGFRDNLTIESRHRGILAHNVRCGSAAKKNFNLQGTDNEFIACVGSMSQEDGFYITGSNNRFTSCKGFVSGRGLKTGAGFNVRSSFNTFSGCESQENRLCNLYLFNATNNIINSFTLDGAGAHAGSDFPNLEYADEQFGNEIVPICSLRLHNAKNNQINVSIINGRTVGGEQWKAKAGIFSLYPKLDTGNIITVNLRDETTDDSFEYRYPTSLFYAVMNRILFNSLDETERYSNRTNFFNTVPYQTFGSVAAKARKLTLTVNDSNTSEVIYTFPLKNNIQWFVYGQQSMNDFNKGKVELIADVRLSYLDTSDNVQYKNTGWYYPTEGSFEVDIKSLKATVTNLKSVRYVEFRIRAFAKTVGTGSDYKVELYNPCFFEVLE